MIPFLCMNGAGMSWHWAAHLLMSDSRRELLIISIFRSFWGTLFEAFNARARCIPDFLLSRSACWLQICFRLGFGKQ